MTRRDDKTLLLEEIKDKIGGSSAMIITGYEKLGPQLSWELAEKLKSTKSCFEVVKKRMFLKAAEQKGFSLDLSKYKGHVGIVFLQGDTIDSTKVFFDFNDKTETKLEILAGYYEGQIYSSKDVQVLSKLPGKNEMRAQFLGLLEAPMAQTLSAFEAILTSVMHCLENKSKQTN